jgi:outer membrane protein assembly factor BamB
MESDNKRNSQNNGTKSPWYHCAVRTAVVAAVFSVIVLGFVVVNYVQGRIIEAEWETQSLNLKKQFKQNPDDEQLLSRIRELDLQYRQNRIERLDFARKGAYLLLAGVTIMLVAVKSADSFKKRVPYPDKTAKTEAEQLQLAKLSRWSVAAALAVLGSGALILATGTDIDFSTDKGKTTSYPSFEEFSRNWPAFRGPQGLGVSAYTNVPDSWDGKTGENILWKTKIPLPGNNSPIVWEDRVFLTGGNQKELKVFCFDGVSGRLLWSAEVVSPHLGNDREPFEVMEDTGFAAPTAVTDGRRVYAIFVTGDVAAFDYSGRSVWTKSLGVPDSSYGYAASLAMYRNLVLIQFDQGGPGDGLSRMIALDGVTGRTVWETKRPVPNSWSSPIVTKIDDQFRLITCGDPWVIAYDPADGTEIWRANCLYGDVAPSPIYANGLVFAVEPDARLIAIRAGGQGNVTETHIAWINDEWGPSICSPLSDGEFVFMLSTPGLFGCYKNSDGTRVYEKDLRDYFIASPSLVGNKLYIMTEEGVMLIAQAGPEYKELKRCELGEKCNASPAFVDGRIYVRGLENLYCIGKTTAE